MTNLNFLIKNKNQFQNFYIQNPVGNYIELTSIKRLNYTKSKYFYVVFDGICTRIKRKYSLDSLITFKKTILGVTYQHKFLLYQYNLLNLKFIEYFSFTKTSMTLKKFKFNI